MSRLTLTLGLLAGLAPSVLAQSTPGRDSIPTRSALARLGLERQWSTAVPVGNVDERIIYANLDHDTLYVQTNRGLVHAIDGESGRRLWSQRLVEGPTRGLDITSNSDQVFVALQDTLFCLDRRSGRLIWSVRLEAMPATGVVADEEVAAIGLRSGKIVAYNTRDHSKDKPNPGRSAGTFAWAWQARGMVDAAPIITPQVVVFASEDNRVYAATRGDAAGRPTLLYRYLTEGPIAGHLAALGGRTIVVPCQDYNLYAIDLFSGETRWIVPTGAPVTVQPIVSGADVIALNADGRLLIIDGRDGSIRGDTATSSRTIRAVSPSRIYLGTSDNDLEIVDRASGQVVASARDTVQRAGLTVRQLSVPVLNTEDDRLLLVSPDGLIYSVREIGRLERTPLRDPDLPPFGTVPLNGFRTTTDEQLAALGATAAAPPSSAPAATPEPDPDADTEAEAP
jgi:outer membrane protein assembly factor BamB